MGGQTVQPQEGRLFGGQTGGATRRARTLANVERRLRAEVRLHVETQELHKGDQLSIKRDRELAEVSSQLAELQTLFDEVSHQLYTECKRIEGVQETVNACVKQSKELESIHHKLEESHQMLTQMLVTRAWREDQDSEDPETRPTAYSSLT